jgi:hypothetical protein
LQHRCSKRIGSRAYSDALLREFFRFDRLECRRGKPKAVDLGLQVARSEVPVDLRRDPRVTMAQDALNGRGVRARHHQQAGRRVPVIPRAG